jgi:hypothetical protein
MGDKSGQTDVRSFCKRQAQPCDSNRLNNKPNTQSNLPKKASCEQHQPKETELAGYVEGMNKNVVTAIEISQSSSFMLKTILAVAVDTTELMTV